METRAKIWLTTREAAAHVGVPYARFTQLAKRGLVPRTLVPGTEQTYRYNVDVLDMWMLDHQEG